MTVSDVWQLASPPPPPPYTHTHTHTHTFFCLGQRGICTIIQMLPGGTHSCGIHIPKGRKLLQCIEFPCYSNVYIPDLTFSHTKCSYIWLACSSSIPERYFKECIVILDLIAVQTFSYFMTSWKYVMLCQQGETKPHIPDLLCACANFSACSSIPVVPL